MNWYILPPSSLTISSSLSLMLLLLITPWQTCSRKNLDSKLISEKKQKIKKNLKQTLRKINYFSKKTTKHSNVQFKNFLRMLKNAFMQLVQMFLFNSNAALTVALVVLCIFLNLYASFIKKPTDRQTDGQTVKLTCLQFIFVVY